MLRLPGTLLLLLKSSALHSGSSNYLCHLQSLTISAESVSFLCTVSSHDHLAHWGRFCGAEMTLSLLSLSIDVKQPCSHPVKSKWDLKNWAPNKRWLLPFSLPILDAAITHGFLCAYMISHMENKITEIWQKIQQKHFIGPHWISARTQQN